MMKSPSNRLFFIFIMLTGSIIAVLGIVLGQLFPFFMENYFIKNDIPFTEEQIDELSINLAFVFAILLRHCIFINWLYRKSINYEELLDPIENVTETARELTKGKLSRKSICERTSDDR